MIKTGRILNFLWISLIFLILIILLQYFSVKWSENIKDKISKKEAPNGSIDVMEE